MERHADRLQARRAEAVDRRAWHRRREAGEQRDAPPEVHPLLLLREAAADHHVDDLLSRQLGHLLERGTDRERTQVVRAGVDQRSLGGAADRRARSGDDDGLGHAPILTEESNARLT